MLIPQELQLSLFYLEFTIYLFFFFLLLLRICTNFMV